VLSWCSEKSDCEEAVKNKLDSPSTAIFYNVEKSENLRPIIVRWEVESQNRLGGREKVAFVCERIDPDSKSEMIVRFNSNIEIERKMYSDLIKRGFSL
jgi:hypothetical protein